MSLSFDELVLKVQADLEEKTRARTKRLFTAIVMRTPVYTGHARANWNVSVDAPDYTVLQDNDLERVLVDIERVDELPVGSVVYLSNGVPYIRLLEYGGYPNPPKKPTGRTTGGFSSQAPAGMVRTSIAEFGFEGETEGDNK